MGQPPVAGLPAAYRPPLVARGGKAFAGAEREIFVQGADFNGAVAAVGVELGGLVRDDVLAAKLVLAGGEGVGNVLVLEREKRSAAGGISQLLQDAIAALDGGAVIGGNRVENDFRA